MLEQPDWGCHQAQAGGVPGRKGSDGMRLFVVAGEGVFEALAQGPMAGSEIAAGLASPTEN